MTEISTDKHLTPPPSFRFNPDLLMDYDEQVNAAVEERAYQEKPLPSFEGVPVLDISPIFNPTNAPVSEVYAQNRVPQSLRRLHMAPRSERSDHATSVQMWRIVERSKLEDGSGLTSSSILRKNSLGEVEGFDPVKHLASNDEGRMSGEDKSTPFVSFSTDPEDLAKNIILRRGFGVKGGRESVVVQVKVDPGRVLTGPLDKEGEVLLLGGVAPSEYVAAYDPQVFVAHLVPEGEITTVHGDRVHRDQVLGYWSLRGL